MKTTSRIILGLLIGSAALYIGGMALMAIDSSRQGIHITYDDDDSYAYDDEYEYDYDFDDEYDVVEEAVETVDDSESASYPVPDRRVIDHRGSPLVITRPDRVTIDVYDTSLNARQYMVDTLIIVSDGGQGVKITVFE